LSAYNYADDKLTIDKLEKKLKEFHFIPQYHFEQFYTKIELINKKIFVFKKNFLSAANDFFKFDYKTSSAT
jgi:hypothetical protein